MAQNLQVCTISDGAMTALKKFRFRKEKTSAALIFKIKNLEIFLDEEHEDISVEDLQAELPSTHPCYIAYSYVRKHDDGRISYPLCFIFLSPSGCKPEQTMMYAGSKTHFVNEGGFTKVFEVRSVEEITEEWLKEKLSFYR